ncbi:MAG TPA: hypothetical protein VFL90_04980 [Methylomirabilota bacterium]|nr:hypothetical protein [Methylomirabilota bacterium]
MSDEKVETVRSSTSGTIGCARNSARNVAVMLDSSSRPQDDALTNSEAFPAGISSCGVTLIEPRLTGITMTFEQVKVIAQRT